MDAARFQTITGKYRKLRVAIVGDFCLDRYLEIDPGKKERSIETGLPVHNVVNVRSQPGGAGTILNNLATLGLAEIFPVGFAGDDGEGTELCRSLRARRGVNLEFFFYTKHRRTFTYTKPLIVEPGRAPVELSRLDFKNWTPTPAVVQGRLIDAVERLGKKVQAVILLDQVDLPETGVITAKLLRAVETISGRRRKLLILADSRRGLRGYPPVVFKMNADELSALVGGKEPLVQKDIEQQAASLSRHLDRQVFITLAERGIIGASPQGEVEHVAALPVRGPIDIVGAGDAVTANLTAALAAGASLGEALELANAAASVVIHQLGTTGTATVDEIKSRLFG